MEYLKGAKLNGLYIFSSSTLISLELNLVTSSGNDRIVLWHLRLGNTSEHGLQKFSQMGCLRKYLISKLDFCENCVHGKSSKTKFGTETHRSGVLDYIHFDICGPSRTMSHNDKRYFMTLIDDYSKRV